MTLTRKEVEKMKKRPAKEKRIAFTTLRGTKIECAVALITQIIKRPFFRYGPLDRCWVSLEGNNEATLEISPETARRLLFAMQKASKRRVA